MIDFSAHLRFEFWFLIRHCTYSVSQMIAQIGDENLFGKYTTISASFSNLTGTVVMIVSINYERNIFRRALESHVDNVRMS